jgi:hypothetical protein
VSFLQAVPGMGKILRVVLLDDIHAITRFPRGQDFVSSGRLVKGAKASAGKRSGTAGTKIGQAYLPWACSAAAVLCLRHTPAGHKSLARVEKKHGKGQAWTVLAHTLARAVYSRLKREVGFARATVLQREERGGGKPAAALGHDGLSRALVLCPEARMASPNALEPRGALPCPCACAWTPPLAPGQRVAVPDGCRVLPLTRTWPSLVPRDMEPLFCRGR